MQYTVQGEPLDIRLPSLLNGEGYTLEVELPGAEISVRMRCVVENSPVFALQLDKEQEAQTGSFSFWTSSTPEPFTMHVPQRQASNGARMILSIRVTDVRATLLCNGVLVDEEWPLGHVAWMGEAHLMVEAGNFKGEIIPVARDEASILLPTDGTTDSGRSLQYWTPKGINTGVGDCMPFWHEETFHLFYLFDRRKHRSKHGLGAHQWAHASTRDLVRWEHHERAIPITEQWEGSICTGSVLHHADTFFAFYTTRTCDGSAAPLSVAVSKDGVHFIKQPPLLRLEAPYDGPSARDPEVFADASGLFHMLVTTSLADVRLRHRGGCLAHLISVDLLHWKQHPPFLIPGYSDQPECADYFCWNGWYYLVFGNHGISRYRMSREPFGPWRQPEDDLLNCPNIRVPKTAAFIGNRRISAGFLHEENGYGGCAVFREILQRPDGTLGSAFVREMLPAGFDACYTCLPLSEGATSGGDRILLDGVQGFCAMALTDLPLGKRMTFRLHPEDDGGSFGICLKSDETYGNGKELRIEPALRRVGFRDWDSGSPPENNRSSIQAVNGLHGDILLDVIVTDAWVDVCVNGERTLMIRDDRPDTSVVCLFAHCARVACEIVTCIGLTEGS